MGLKLLLIVPLTALIIFMTVYGSTAKTNLNQKEPDYYAALRLVGHRLLLSSGDTKSRVLPIEKTADEVYRIRFEKKLSIQPDSVISIIREATALASLPGSYNVNVVDCAENKIVYSYVMAEPGSGNNDIITCLGRALPVGCYSISIDYTLPPTKKQIYLLGAALSILLLALYPLYHYFKPVKKPVPTTSQRLGNTVFNPEKRYLEIAGEITELTDKEAKLLSIFASTPNEIINRETLQKEVWENEGIIVTRSLDVFISRLRKKLEGDPAIKLVNIHGRGYKLEVT